MRKGLVHPFSLWTSINYSLVSHHDDGLWLESYLDSGILDQEGNPGNLIGGR